MHPLTMKFGARVHRAFSRDTTNASFIPEVDGLRFLAIAAVVAYHLDGYIREKSGLSMAGPVRAVLGKGFIGVELFFAISGFVLALPFAEHYLFGEKRPQLSRYFARRLTRLEPPYLLNIFALLGLLVVTGRTTMHAMLPEALASAVYIHNIVFPHSNGVNAAFWSLEVEVQFYCLAPFLASVFRIKSVAARRSVICGAIAAVGLLRPLLPGGIEHGHTLAHQLHFFLVGFLAVDCYLLGWGERDYFADLLALGAAVAILMALHLDVAPHLTIPPLFVCVFVGAFRGRLFPRFLRLAPVYLIGGGCYTIYLWHQAVIAFAGRFVVGLPWAAQMITLGAVVLAMSAALFVMIEKPCMHRDWPQRLRRAVRNQALRGELGEQVR